MARAPFPDHEEARHRHLVTGLVGPHARLYQDSTTFHHTIDTLVAWLPVWVEAMAAESRKTDAATALRIKAMELTHTGPQIILSPEAVQQLADGHGLNLTAASVEAARERADLSRRLREEYQAQAGPEQVGPHAYRRGDGKTADSCGYPGCRRLPGAALHDTAAVEPHPAENRAGAADHCERCLRHTDDPIHRDRTVPIPGPHPSRIPHGYTGPGPCQVDGCGLGPFARVHREEHDNPVCQRRAIAHGACTQPGGLCHCRCHVQPHEFTADATLADRCTTCQGRFPLDHEIHQHRFVVDADGAPCCELPYAHPTHIRVEGIHPASGHPHRGDNPSCCHDCGHHRAQHDEATEEERAVMFGPGYVRPVTVVTSGDPDTEEPPT